ncbi:MAG: hypothetical protein J6I96_02565 [Oscillospiraceae bacterium]|nr:hypothetical protein [Oscillospiraceae bacterium]
MGYGGFLMEVMRRELEKRQENQIMSRLAKAAFPFEKTLDEFQMDHLNSSVQLFQPVSSSFKIKRIIFDR